MVMVNGETKPINKLSEIMFGAESVPPRGYKLARIGWIFGQPCAHTRAYTMEKNVMQNETHQVIKRAERTKKPAAPDEMRRRARW